MSEIDAFYEALENPPKPNEALKALMRRGRSMLPPAPDPAEAMRSKCEAIARDHVGLCMVGSVEWVRVQRIVDAIAALKGQRRGEVTR